MVVGEAIVAIVAIVMGCVMLTMLAKYGVKAVRAIFGSGEGDGSSLTTKELEVMIRRAVREETEVLREETHALREEVERLERKVDEKVEPKRVEPPEDPHDFGLIAEGETPGEADRA